MDLQEFIKESLLQLSLGVKEANDAIASALKTDNRVYILRSSKMDDRSVVDFDVAVSLKKDSASGGKGVLKLAVANIGAGVNTETTHETVSRIKFKVAIDWCVI